MFTHHLPPLPPAAHEEEDKHYYETQKEETKTMSNTTNTRHQHDKDDYFILETRGTASKFVLHAIGILILLAGVLTLLPNKSDAYDVKSGDTLSEIAVKCGDTLSNLVEANNIANPDLIIVGQNLITGCDDSIVGGGDIVGNTDNIEPVDPVEPVTADPVEAVDKAALTGDVVHHWLHRIRSVESGGNVCGGNNYSAYNPNDPSWGAYQFMLGTWEQAINTTGVDAGWYTHPKDAPIHIQDKVAYAWFSYLLQQAGGDAHRAIMAWNAGAGTITHNMEVPGVTRNSYLPKVLNVC